MRSIAFAVAIIAISGCSTRCNKNEVIETKWLWNDYWSQPLHYLDNKCAPAALTPLDPPSKSPDKP